MVMCKTPSAESHDHVVMDARKKKGLSGDLYWNFMNLKLCY